jgi:hypothetical protein
VLRIRIDFGRLDPDPRGQGAKIISKNKKRGNFMFEGLNVRFFCTEDSIL